MVRITYDKNRQLFHLENGSVSYVIALAAGKYPLLLHWGKALRTVHDDLLARRCGFHGGEFTLHETPLDRLPQECPVFGWGDMREGVLQARFADGSECLDLRYLRHRITDEQPDLGDMPSARGEHSKTLTITLRDETTGFEADLHYTLWEDADVLGRAMTLRAAQEAVTLERAYSFALELENSNYTMITLEGAWARERQWISRPLVPGRQATGTVRGASSQQTSPFLALTAPGANERTGEAFGFALCWSGSFASTVDVDQFGAARVMMGVQDFDFAWKLSPGEVFHTPEAYLAYSENGLQGLSLACHRFIRAHVLCGPYAASERPILLNSWEAAYFDIDEEKLCALAAEARALDMDLFVLDDGWFGHRDRDDSSLGDWVDDKRKLPGGLKRLSERVHGMGLKFGLWVEPEMISPDSDLYRAHPDYCIHSGNRMRVENRHQLVLDMTRADVRAYVTEAITDALTRAQVDYVKWDMNRNINMIGSAQLPKERIGEFHVRYILGVYEVMRTITSRFPNVLFESCAGGGGRFDLGMMTIMPQAWTSDDTDAWMRCRIQYATSLLFPPSCMGAHVSAVPNHQTGRFSPLKTRAAVAMHGTFGYELDPAKLSAEEKTAIRACNRRVRAWQDILLHGEFYRLQSPFETDAFAVMAVSRDRSRAVVTYVARETLPNTLPSLLRLAGLDENADYRDEDTNLVFGGDELTRRGIPLPALHSDYDSVQFFLRKVEKE